MRLRLLAYIFLLAIVLPTMADTPIKSKDDKDYIIGKQYYARKNYDKARYYLLRAVKENPDHEQALQMLVHIEDSTKHYATAIVHCNELLALNPYNEHQWLTKINLYRKQGNDVEADRLLERICLIYPDDEKLQRRLKGRREEIALANYKKQRENNDTEGQIQSLRTFIRDGQSTGSVSRNEMSEYYTRLTSLLEQQGRTSEALEVAQQGLNFAPGNSTLIRKRVGILTGQGRTMEAYSFVKGLMKRNNSAQLTQMLRDLEETLLQQAQLNDAYIMHGRRWERLKASSPRSSDAQESLNFLISSSVTRNYLDDAQAYLQEARDLFGNTPQLLYKSYLVEHRLGNTSRAFQFLRLIHENDTTNQEVTDLLAADALKEAADYMIDLRYSDAVVLLDSILGMNPSEEIAISATHKRAICQTYLNEKEQKRQLVEWEILASQLLREHRAEELIAVCDSALAVDSTLEMMYYYKGLAYERLHKWDEAYECLKRYKPSPMELPEHRRLLNSLLSHNYLNTLLFEYQQARLGMEDRLTANAHVSYSRLLRNDDTVTAELHYTARDVDAEEANEYYDDNDNLIIKPNTNPKVLDRGGVGIQLYAAYRHVFSKKVSGQLGAGWANKYFPQITARADVDWELPRNWMISPRASFRRTDSSHRDASKNLIKGRSNIYNIGATATKSYTQLNFSFGADAYLIRKNLYFNGTAKVQYFPLEKTHTHVFATVGAGTAPEMEIIDTALPTGFSKLNTFVGAGAFYAITAHLGVSLTGTWYNLSDNIGKHRNYFYVIGQFQIKF